MKRLPIPLLFLLLATGCGRPPAETETVWLSVEGMTCENCVRGITGALTRKEGVREVAVSLEKETARVVYDPDERKAAEIAEAIDALQYKASILPEPPAE